MQWLKQSTAFTTIIGPILDSTGAEYAAAVIGDLDITKNGVTTAMAAAATLTYISNGRYTLVGTTGNSDTLGRVDITCNKATYQMPQKTFSVLPATVFDALITNATTAAGGLGDIQRMAGTALTGRDIGASVLLSSGTGAGQISLTDGLVTLAGVTHTGAVIPTVTTVGTLTTYTGNTPQTGDAFDRIGPTGSGLTSLAPAATALSTATWSGARAGYLDNLSGGAVALAAGVAVTSLGTDVISAASVSAAAVAKIQAGLSTLTQAQVTGGAYSIQSTSCVLGDVRIANLDAPASTRSTFNPASDTVILNATQANYAPAKAGDAMTLTSGERTAIANEVEAQIIDDTDAEKVLAAITDKIASVNPTLGELSLAAIASASATAVWAGGTRTLTSGDNIVLAKGVGITGFNDIAATAIVSNGAITTSGGAVSTVTTTGTATSLTNLPAMPANWLTAYGINADAVTKIQNGLATVGAAMTLTAAYDAAKTAADATTVATALSNLQTHGDSTWATATGFSTFNPATDTVARVTLVDTCAVNSDMRGTDNAATAGAAMTLTSAYDAAKTAADAATVAAAFSSLQTHGDSTWSTATGFSTFNPATDVVARVTLVDTCATNSDMRGTDNAALATTLDDVVSTLTAVTTVTSQFRFTEPNRVDATASVASDVMDSLEATQTAVQQLQQLAYSDQYIDTASVPWCIVNTQAGTGDVGTGTELMRKRIRDIHGVNIVSTGIVPGKIFQ